MTNQVTPQQAKELFDGDCQQMARSLGYKSVHAIYMWAKREFIPESAYLKLRYELKPEAFDAKGRIKARKR